MIDEHDVREMLHRRANQVPTSAIDATRATRRARRRLFANGAVAVLATAAIAMATFAGVGAIRSAPIPADDPSEELGIFALVAGRIVFETLGTDSGYAPGFWAIDPNGPSDTTDGPSVADDVASTLVPLEVDGEPLGWSSDGTELLLVRSVGDDLFPEQYLSILHADGTETRLNENPMGIADAMISPDGTRVVFAGQYDLSGLYVIDAQGGQPVLLPIPQVGEGAGSPTFSPDGTQIAYLAGNRDGEVWVANADGTGAHEILADEPTAFRGVSGPVWSPAGDRIAIGLGTHERSGGSIYTFAPDGSDFTQVIVGGSSPSWSPDGSQIAYTIQCDEDPTYTCVQFDPQAGLNPPGLAIADSDGSNVRAFGFAASGPWHPGTSVQTDDATPTPSDGFARVNGEVLRFTGILSDQSLGDLVAVNPVTSEERVLVENLSNVISAEWSADGRWVAYERFPLDSARGQIELWVVGASQEPRLIGRAGNGDLFADGSMGWVWSSTGAELLTAHLSSLNGDAQTIDRSRLSVIDFETGETTDLGTVDGGVGRDPAWSPDGTRIAFASGDGSVYSVDVGSGERSLLTRFPDTDLDPAFSVHSIRWSPDGTHISVMNTMGGERLYLMDADGSNVRLLTEGYELLLAAWSPDGTRLAFAEGFQAEGEVRILVAPMDGSDPAEIGSVPFVGCTYHYKCGVTWSPDGSTIGFHKDEGEDSAIASDGSSEPASIDDLTYLSWAGGRYGGA